MKNRIILFSALIVVLTWATQPPLSDTALTNDTQALEYCKTHNNTYIVVVWPRGFKALEFIITRLKGYASIKYAKTMMLNKKTMFLLFRALHKEMSYKTAKSFFKPYLTKHQQKPQLVAALLFQTDAPLEMILKWKYAIRALVGQSYYSFHINDYYCPETIEAAQAVFCDFNP